MRDGGRYRRSYAPRRRTFIQPPNRLRRLRTISVVVVLLFGAAVAAAWFLPRFLDWGQYRSAVEAVASAGLGRPVRIAGPIRLSLLPQATLVAGDVSVPDMGDGASAVATQLRLQVALGPLLAGRIELEDLVLRGPHMRLPWPLTALVSRTGPPSPGLHARVEDGTLAIGGLQVTDISGELRVDPATGLLSAAGLASVMGRPWQMTGRLGQAGRDGSATVAISLDGKGSAVGTGGSLSGQITADGELTGQISGRGPDLSLLLPAPARAWRADGQVKAGSGLVIAQDLELDIGGAPARGAVAVRLLPQLRLDAALATSQLDLDAWLAPLLHEGQPTLPTGIELSADAAQLAGGTLHQLRTGFEFSGSGLTLREAEAVLPGNATLHLTGRLATGRFAGEARLAAPDMAQTLAWLRPQAPALIDAIPQGALQTVLLSAAVTAEAGNLTFGDLTGDANGAPLSGDLALRGGDRPAVAANLVVAGPVLDPWLPGAPSGLTDAATRLTNLPNRFAGFDADVTLTASKPVWHGITLGQLTVEARCNAGTLEVRHALLTGEDVSVGVTGSLAAGGRITDGRLDLSLGHAEWLEGHLPAEWPFSHALFHGPVTLRAMASGLPTALAITAAAELSDARAQMTGSLDLAGRRWKGAMSLHHPGAPRLFWALGLGDMVGWLGDGSLSLQAGVEAGPDRVTLSSVELSAGALRATGDLDASGLAGDHHAVTGKIDAETLPLPVVNPQSTDPWMLTLLHTTDAKVTIHAAQLLWGLAPVAEDATATASITNGTIRIDGLEAHVAGGTLAAQLSLNLATPPHLAVSGKAAGLILDGPFSGTPLDLVDGHLDVSADVSGSGYSPAGVLATLGGTLHLTVRNGALAGLDAGKVLAALQPGGTASIADTQSAVSNALGGGNTPFSQLDLDGTVSRGMITLSRGDITAPAGSIATTGNLDLPGETIDAHLAFRPALENSPLISLRLIGPVASPNRTPELAGLTRWLAQR